ncbi:MAG: hypothetical protein GX496_00840, partial [Firmicutes bacterium]|nr:hypothetical protein [Bacillota bacterium]
MRLQAPRMGSPLGKAALAVVVATAVLAISRSELGSHRTWAEGPAPALLPATTPLGGSF